MLCKLCQELTKTWERILSLTIKSLSINITETEDSISLLIILSCVDNDLMQWTMTQWSPLTHYHSEREQDSRAGALAWPHQTRALISDSWIFAAWAWPEPSSLSLISLITLGYIRADIQSCHATLSSLVSANLMEYYASSGYPLHLHPSYQIS